MYQGPAGYINIIGAGDGDDPEFFRLYIGQALNLRARLEQHHDPNHRKRYPSLQYGIMDAFNRPLRTICYGQFPTALLEADPEMLLLYTYFSISLRNLALLSSRPFLQRRWSGICQMISKYLSECASQCYIAIVPEPERYRCLKAYGGKPGIPERILGPPNRGILPEAC